VDGVKAVPPHQRLVLAEQIHPKRWEGNQPRPVRRVWIPKPGKAEQRALGLPICAAYCPSSQEMFGMPWVFLLVDRNARSTLLISFYHRFMRTTRGFLLPLLLGRLAQGCNDLRSQCNPTRTQWGGAHTLQTSSFAPLGNGRNVHIEQIGCGSWRVTSIASLACGYRFRTLWLPET
jgi:hypothetical protein